MAKQDRGIEQTDVLPFRVQFQGPRVIVAGQDDLSHARPPSPQTQATWTLLGSSFRQREATPGQRVTHGSDRPQGDGFDN